MHKIAVIIISVAFTSAYAATSTVKVNPQRDAYYGDLHLHTSYSLDAYVLYGTKVDPDDAYRFAKGETVQYLGQTVRRREPLDFMAVTDHAESLGVFNELENPQSAISRSTIGKAVKSELAGVTGPYGRRDSLKYSPGNFPSAMSKYFNGVDKNPLPQELRAESVSAWTREINFANRNYAPGKFTTFVAYEWTSLGDLRAPVNFHRNVIFKGDSAPYPFTSVDSRKPEDLWTWLETLRKKGYEALAIPHVAKHSKGLMYDWLDSDRRPIDGAYARRRQANEPLSEISQLLGSSETHPLLSASDEFADFELGETAGPLALGMPGSYLRNGLGRGLVLERSLGVNPFKFGFAGGSDFHTGLSTSAQADFGGEEGAAVGPDRPTKERAATILGDGHPPVKFLGMSTLLKRTSGSLTGVWAESNTRASIYDALRRRETFATSGTRLKFRFFGGWGFSDSLFGSSDWVQKAYRDGVAMGGDLPAKPRNGKAPTFVIWAMKDPNGANLDRVQVVKVWEENGAQKEKVFDVVWSGARKPDATAGKLPAVGDTSDLKTGNYSNRIGATELKTLWRDPDFDPHRFVAYYLRVLEIPTPRWSTLLAIQYHLPLPKDVPATEQQRGWSSPIWFSP